MYFEDFFQAELVHISLLWLQVTAHNRLPWWFCSALLSRATILPWPWSCQTSLAKQVCSSTRGGWQTLALRKTWTRMWHCFMSLWPYLLTRPHALGYTKFQTSYESECLCSQGNSHISDWVIIFCLHIHTPPAAWYKDFFPFSPRELQKVPHAFTYLLCFDL